MGDHDITVLNTLIATTIDSANGFEEAARRASAQGLASQFAEFARDRWAVVSKLEAEVRRLGGSPRQQGTTKAAAHRRWLDLKNAVAGSDKAVVQEVENGESYIKNKYEAALRDDQLSEATRRAISGAFDSVRQGHDSVRSLGLAHGTRSPSGQQEGIDWRKVGTGIGIAAAVGGVAYAANRMMGSRRQGAAGRRQRRGASQTSRLGASSTGSSTMAAGGLSPTGSSTTAAGGMSPTGSSTMAASGTSSIGPAGAQPATTTAGNPSPASDAGRRSGTSCAKRSGASRNRSASGSASAGMTAGLSNDQPGQAQGFEAPADSGGSSGTTGIGSMGATGNRDDFGKA